MRRFSVNTSKMIFVPRILELKNLERNYGDFILSCRHRDILRCSKTKHFRSCYAPDGCYSHIPYEICTRNYYAIIGKKDRAGDFLWRAFVEFYSLVGNYTKESKTGIRIYKIYGNPPPGTQAIILNQIFPLVDELYFVDKDAS